MRFICKCVPFKILPRFYNSSGFLKLTSFVHLFIPFIVSKWRTPEQNLPLGGKALWPQQSCFTPSPGSPSEQSMRDTLSRDLFSLTSSRETKSLASSESPSKVSASKSQLQFTMKFMVSASVSPRNGDKPLSLQKRERTITIQKPCLPAGIKRRERKLLRPKLI